MQRNLNTEDKKKQLYSDYKKVVIRHPSYRIWAKRWADLSPEERWESQ